MLQIGFEGWYLPLAGELILVAVASWLVMRGIKVSDRAVGAYDKVMEASSDVYDKVSKCERMMFDYGVRLEVIEVQSRRLGAVVHAPSNISLGGGFGRQPVVVQRRLEGALLGRGIAVHTDVEVLRRLSEGLNTAREIQASLGRSREHTARLLKKLYDAGLVVRDEVAKPYTYELTEAGRRALGEGGSSG